MIPDIIKRCPTLSCWTSWKHPYLIHLNTSCLLYHINKLVVFSWVNFFWGRGFLNIYFYNSPLVCNWPFPIPSPHTPGWLNYAPWVMNLSIIQCHVGVWSQFNKDASWFGDVLLLPLGFSVLVVFGVVLHSFLQSFFLRVFHQVYLNKTLPSSSFHTWTYIEEKVITHLTNLFSSLTLPKSLSSLQLKQNQVFHETHYSTLIYLEKIIETLGFCLLFTIPTFNISQLVERLFFFTKAILFKNPNTRAS